MIGNNCCVPCEEDSSLAGWGEESALNQREMAEVLCQQFHPSFISTWCSASLEHER